MTDSGVLAVYVRYVYNFIDEMNEMYDGLEEDYDIEGYKSTLLEVVRKLEAEALQSKAEECPICYTMKVLDSVSMFCEKRICSDCRQIEETCHFLGILPGALM